MSGQKAKEGSPEVKKRKFYDPVKLKDELESIAKYQSHRENMPKELL